MHARGAVDDRNEVEMLMPVIQELKDGLGVTQADLDFTCSGSTDYLAGQGFSFVGTLDGVGPYPPISESHVEMDGAWALYEAWVKIQTGAADTALVYSYGKSSPGDLPRVLSRQLDPYYYGPLWPDSVSLAALQARALLDSGKATERGPGRDRRPLPGRGQGQPLRHDQRRLRRRRHPGRGPRSSPRCASTTARPSPTAPSPSCWPPTTGPAS